MDHKSKRSIKDVLTTMYGPEKAKTPLPPRVTIEQDIWAVSERTKLAAKAYLATVSAENEAAVILAKTNHAKHAAYALLYELECELDDLEKKSGIPGATRFHTLDNEADEGDEDK